MTNPIAGVFEVRAWGSPVGEGVSGARYCTLDAVCKSNTPASPFVVANELLAMRLAMVLGLPVPPGLAVRAEEGGLAYVAIRFGPKGERPPPVIADTAVEHNHWEAAGCAAFDCWIANADRHYRNVAYVPNFVPFTVFDHDRALFGAEFQGLHRLATMRDAPTVTGVLHDHLERAEHLHDWAEHIRDVPDRVVSTFAKQCVDIGALDSEQQADAVVDFLSHRKTRIMEYLRSSADAFPSITEWTFR